MVVMDGAWWNQRTLTDGHVVLENTGRTNVVHPAARHWIRWRFIDEVLTRFYVDYGLEPGFGLNGVELYNPILWSPHCRRAPRYFGRLCEWHFHPEDDPYVRSLVSKVRPASLREFVEGLEGSWDSWSAYRRDGIERLGLGVAGVPGHQACFHRRGKSLLQVMYRVALIVRNDGMTWKQVSTSDGKSIYSYPSSNLDNSVQQTTVKLLLEPSGHPTTSPTSSYFVVSRSQSPIAAIRTDGTVATRAGNVNLAEMWRAGYDEEELASEIVTVAC